MECNCGAYIPSGMARCPQCDLIADREADVRLLNKQKQSVDQRIEARQNRWRASLSAASVPLDIDDLPITVSPDQVLPLKPIFNHLDQVRRAGGNRFDPMRRVWHRLEEWGIDPDSELEDLLEFLDESKVGVDLWTSPKRFGQAKYRCQLYRLMDGWSLQRVMLAEAPTAKAAVAAALVAAVDQGRLMLDA